jgi:SAM-dependent methyltransferase
MELGFILSSSTAVSLFPGIAYDTDLWAAARSSRCAAPQDRAGPRGQRANPFRLQAMTGPTRDFWEQRFQAKQTPWDRGAPSPQLAAWLDSRALTPCRIVVPGCGNGHEVVVLALRGFEVTALDYAPAAIAATRGRLARANADATLVQADVTQWMPPAPFDAVYEQTCLCALHPDRWRVYADRLPQWLAPRGRLYALFMQVPRPGAAEGLVEGPPYHCDINAMRALFASSLWEWPAPPYERVPHSGTWAELAVVLTRRLAAMAGAPGAR